jgi:ubiquinone/menaquinone biosynthesis C-methylase UbiE
MRLYAERLRSGEALRALELGFGGGNNIVFLATEGFETWGIEGSPSAHAFASARMKEKRINTELTVGDFVRLPYDNEFFDLVIDREAVYCNMPSAIKKIIREVVRVLKKGGRFLTFMYSLEHGSRLSDGGKLIDVNTYNDFVQGNFAGTGITHFFSEKEILNYLKDFEIEFMKHLRVDSLIPYKRNEYAEYHTCARKR